MFKSSKFQKIQEKITKNNLIELQEKIIKNLIQNLQSKTKFPKIMKIPPKLLPGIFHGILTEGTSLVQFYLT